MLKIKQYTILCLMAIAVIAFATVPAMAGSAAEAKKHSQEMMEHAEEMVSHGDAGHLDIMAEHAKEMITHAKGTISSLPAGDSHGKTAKKHIDVAIEEAEAAIDHGGQGHGDVAMKHANAALEHAKEGDSHVASVK